MIDYHLENPEPCIYSIKHYGIFPRFLRRLQQVSKETVRFFKSEGMGMAANLKLRKQHMPKANEQYRVQGQVSAGGITVAVAVATISSN